MTKIRNVLLFVLFAHLTVTACKEFDTNSVGTQFHPYNSFVTKFRQLVYVEYKDGTADVWGPCADRVEYEVKDSSHVLIKSDLDSLVVVAYGFAAHDTIRDEKEKTKVLGVVDYHGNLDIFSNKPFALYLTGLKMNSDTETAIQTSGAGDCFLVLTDKADNQLNGACVFGGQLLFDGKGSLTINTKKTDALVAKKGLTCSYPVSVNIRSLEGKGVKVESGELKIADGTWDIQSRDNEILSATQTVIMNGGNCYGIGAKHSDVTFGGNYFTWIASIDTVSFQKDSIYAVQRYRIEEPNPVAVCNLKSVFDQTAPHILTANAKIEKGDLLTFTKK